MRQGSVKTNRLQIEYLEDGPPDGLPVLLLHGFPDNATSWTAVMASLAAGGLRSVAPFVRGCGLTHFLREETPRAGDFAALGQDAIDLVDALKLTNLIVVGQDWGSPTAEILALERPELVAGLLKLNWYGVYTMAELAKAQGFQYSQLRTLWYVWLLQTPLGEMVLRYDRGGLAKALWAEWSPTWLESARDEGLSAVLDSFAGDDWFKVALSAYRTGTPLAELDPLDDALRERLKAPGPVRCKTSFLLGADDGVERTPLSDDAVARYFPRAISRTSLAGVGHFPQRESPDAVSRAILELRGSSKG